MEDKKEVKAAFVAGDKVTVSPAGMAGLVGPYKNTGTIEMTNGGRVLITHDSADKDMDLANMKRWHKGSNLKKK